jgi:hypothetical protein
MTPDRVIFERDIAAAPFLEGVARNRWTLEILTWPHCVFSITARDGHRFYLRLNFDGYPAQPPTGGLWDPATGTIPAAEKWPKGDEVFSSVFRRDWQNGTALYMPMDRVSLAGHHDWPSQYPHLVWDPVKGLTQYLAEVHRLLNARGYHGLRG